MFQDNKALGWLAFFGTWILIFTNFVPISMMVTLEIVKLGQATLMQYDILMTDTIKEEGEPDEVIPMNAQASNLNEELGQVEYVFSDKTGTLTCNIMNFKKFTAGKYSYGTGKEPEKPQIENVCFEDPEMFKIIDGPH